MSLRVLVLGGSGFVGSALIPRLLAAGHDTALVNRGSRAVRGVRQLAADRNQPAALAACRAELGPIDVVIDTSSYSRGQTERAWKAFGGAARRWLHLGTAAAYADTPGRAPAETDPIGGGAEWGDYGREKSAADDFLLAQSGPPAVTILRPPYLYGPANNCDRETFVWRRFLRGRPVLLPGDGATLIQFLHVADLADAMLATIAEGADGVGVFNVAGAEQPTFREWTALLARAADCPDLSIAAGNAAAGRHPRQYFPFRDGDVRVATTRSAERLGFVPKHTLEDGFRQTFATYRREELRTDPIDGAVEDEILRRLRM